MSTSPQDPPQARHAQLLADLSAWIARPKGQSLEEFVSERAGRESAHEALAAIDEAQRSYDDLRAAREQEGVSREAWLGRLLKPVAQVDPNTGDHALKVGEALISADSPAALAGKLTGALVGGLELAPEDQGALNATLEVAKSVAPPPVQAFLQSYFEAPERAPVEREVKGVLAGTLLKVNQSRPKEEQVSSAALGLLSDSALFRVKTAYQVGQALLEPEVAVGKVIDRAAAHVATVAKQAVQLGLARAGAVAGAWIGNLVGLGPVGATLGGVVGEWAGEKVGKVVEEGVRVVAEGVKAVARVAVSAVKSAVKSVGRWISSWF